MTKTEHSPLPWIAGGWDGPIDCVYDANGDAVCEPSPPNAALIVTACNSYYDNQQAIAELVDMVERLQDSLHVAYCEVDCDDPEEGCVEECIDARALIAKHKAKP